MKRMLGSLVFSFGLVSHLPLAAASSNDLSLVSETADSWSYASKEDPSAEAIFLVSKKTFASAADAQDYCKQLGGFRIPETSSYLVLVVASGLFQDKNLPQGFLGTDFPQKAEVAGWIAPSTTETREDLILVSLKDGEGKSFKIKDLNDLRSQAGLSEFRAPVVCTSDSYAAQIEDYFKN